jgi:hypothetical protein
MSKYTHNFRIKRAGEKKTNKKNFFRTHKQILNKEHVGFNLS